MECTARQGYVQHDLESGTEQLKELKLLQKENERSRRTVLDLTLVTLILSEAARGNHLAPRVDVPVQVWFAAR